jgi:hypothetical protein
MNEYAILWNMKGLDWYFFALTMPESGRTALLNESGRELCSIHYANGNIDNRANKWLSLYTDADPSGFFEEANALGAEGCMFDGILHMDEALAARLQEKYGKKVKIIGAVKKTPAEPAPKIAEHRSLVPAYEED